MTALEDEISKISTDARLHPVSVIGDDRSRVRTYAVAAVWRVFKTGS
jgi:hypothetical protein